MKDLIEFIARSLVDNPSQVTVTTERRGSVTHFRLSVAREDMGRVIGRNGRVANAMRILLNVSAARQGKQASMDVEEPA